MMPTVLVVEDEAVVREVVVAVLKQLGYRALEAADGKAGLKMLAKIVGQELASKGITANVLAPGIVMAGLSARIYEADPTFRSRVAQAIPLGEMQSAESVAGAFYFLCSADSDYMTGATLLVDGGASLVRRDAPGD